MCGSFTQPGDINIIEGFRARFGVEVSDDPGDAGQPVSHEQKATPFRDVNVVFAGKDGVVRVASMYWQLIHHWNQEFKSKYTAFNTRVESLDERHNEPLLRRRRCSCSIITLEPTQIIAEVHNRMPFVLPEEDVKTWLDPEITEFDKLMGMIRPINSEDLERSAEA